MERWGDKRGSEATISLATDQWSCVNVSGLVVEPRVRARVVRHRTSVINQICALLRLPRK